MSDRLAEMESFINAAGWSVAVREPIQGDASTRSYQRLSMDGRNAVLMNAPRGKEGAGEPDGATVEQRRAIGYNALARLAGPNMEAFLVVADQLGMRGFSAPEIIHADVEAGFALLEDFGAGVYAQIVGADPSREAELYEAAVDCLAAIYRSSFPRRAEWGGSPWTIRDYDEAALLAETDLFLDYYAPDAGRAIGLAERAQFYDLWRAAFRTLDAHASGLALRDFHAENLFWLQEREHERRVGLIDFQDALFAHPSYDLSSLLEDIRRDVDEDLFEPLKRRFCEGAGVAYDDAFQAAYAVQSAQRATKLLGFPVRADVDFGKPQYRALLPRVRRHLQRGLSHPACADLRGWFEEYCPNALEGES